MQALIVDDSRAQRTILGGMVRQLGFEVATAIHGLDALAQLQAGARPDLMLVDWNMPEMNGYELVKSVRAEPAYSDIKIMMVTTETEVMQVAAALSAGANEYLMKPFTGEMIADKLSLMGLVGDG